MTGPSEKTRREVFARDNGECQFFCGGKQATEISHFDHQGVGGLPPDHWKNQPQNLAASCGLCHRRIHSGYRWVEFVPPKILTSGISCETLVMKIIDPSGNEIPESDLWFYNRWKKLYAQMAAQSLQTVSEIDGSIGEMMRDLRDGAEFLQGARSFDEHVSGLGWDPIKANDVADVYEWAIEHGGWPSEVNFCKMQLICESLSTDSDLSPAGKEHHERVCRSVMDSAASGASYSTLRRDLIEAGAITAKQRVYLVYSPWGLSRSPAFSDRPIDGPSLHVFVRTRKEEELIAAALQRGLAVLKVAAFKGRLRFKPGRNGGLFDTVTGSEIELLTLEEWMGEDERS